MNIDRHAGLAGILGGFGYLLFAALYVAAHGLDARPDHRVVLELSQDTWYALGVLPYPLQLLCFSRATALPALHRSPVTRTLLALSRLGLIAAGTGHALLAWPHGGDWRSAPTELIGWPLHMTGYVTFGLGAGLAVLLNARSWWAHPVQWQVGALGASLTASMVAGMLDPDAGMEYTLLPLALYGLTWIQLGRTLRAGSRRAPRPAAGVTV